MSHRVTLASLAIFAGIGLVGCGADNGKSKDGGQPETPAAGSGDAEGTNPPKTDPPPVEPPKNEDGDEPIIGADLGVGSKGGQFVVVLEWQTPLEAEEYLSARLTFADAVRKQPASVADVAFEPWMPSMGHGTAMDDQTITADAASPYIFAVSDAYLIMGGEWEIKVTATVNGVRDTAYVAARVR